MINAWPSVLCSIEIGRLGILILIRGCSMFINYATQGCRGRVSGPALQYWTIWILLRYRGERRSKIPTNSFLYQPRICQRIYLKRKWQFMIVCEIVYARSYKNLIVAKPGNRLKKPLLRKWKLTHKVEEQPIRLLNSFCKHHVVYIRHKTVNEKSIEIQRKTN